VVIVGRGTQAILARRSDVLRVRVVAPFEQRVATVAQRDDLSLEQAQRKVKCMDRQRDQYLRRVEHCDPNDLHLYDVIINTGMIAIDDAVDMTVTALQSKAERLHQSGVDCAAAQTRAGCPKVEELWIRRF
jgi:cytidylate kinase